jgi:hypothetical protein
MEVEATPAQLLAVHAALGEASGGGKFVSYEALVGGFTAAGVGNRGLSRITEGLRGFQGQEAIDWQRALVLAHAASRTVKSATLEGGRAELGAEYRKNLSGKKVAQINKTAWCVAVLCVLCLCVCARAVLCCKNVCTCCAVGLRGTGTAASLQRRSPRSSSSRRSTRKNF